MRLVIALSVAAALAVFLLYTSLAGGGTPSLKPSQARGKTGKVEIVGAVVGPVRGDSHASGLRFRLRDIGGKRSIPVVYRGTVPDQFKVGRDVVASGTVRSGRLASNAITTKCPSKYTARKSGS